MKSPAQSGDKLMKSLPLWTVKKAHVVAMFVLAVGLLATAYLFQVLAMLRMQESQNRWRL